jgi:anti-sigma regulatory factor (Ser/Thr protein kinase)
VHFDFSIEAGDFSRAGNAASKVKNILKQLGVPGSTVKRAMVALFEAETNVVGHSYGGTMKVDVNGSKIHVLVRDEGPGIEDIGLAMSEGYSTATEEIREMGFGAGMGLPNIKQNTDYLDIRSSPGGHTEVEMIIYFTEKNEETAG